MTIERFISDAELDHYRQAIGRRIVISDDMSPTVTSRFAMVGGAPVERTPLRHWAHFLSMPRRDEVDEDGHPIRGKFIPPISLPRRMFAAGSVDFFSPLTAGAPAERASTIENIEHKAGRSGELVFVSIAHEVMQSGVLCIRESQTLVYRSASKASGPTGGDNAGARVSHGFDVAASFTPTSVDLFRFSSVTLNSHRIHYDQAYAREVEGYPGLVVHAPYIAVLLSNLAQQELGEPLKSFTFRAKSPLFVDRRIELAAKLKGRVIELAAIDPVGVIAVEASARGRENGR
ncbi:MAG: hypothetical protein R3C54_08220 [Parvularculaceae bacterium]